MTRLAIVPAALALLLAAAPTAAAAPTEFFGIAQGANRLGDQDAQGIAAAKVRTERFLLHWPTLQPSRGGAIDWTETDRFVGRLASHGVRPVPFLWGSPRWVAPKFGHPPLDTAADEQAWRDFVQAAVARYGRGGSYWDNGYPQEYGPDAVPLPIHAWQVWNEPNLPKYFSPSPSPAKYARLLKISHDVITAQDPQALIVLAGMVGYAETKAWTFLEDLYQVDGARGDFDAAALHPYASDIAKFSNAVRQFHQVMTQRGDGGTPLWLTELGWGSAPPDSFGINKGIEGQERLLRRSFNEILSNREAWNVQRLFWFYWRDPSEHPPGTCSFCSSAGLLRYNRTAKPAFNTFRGFTAETDPPSLTPLSGPGPGSFISDSTPSFSFSSDDDTAIFECRVDAQAFSQCSSPYTPALSDGAHTVQVKAIDAPGNESPIRTRSFNVDTTDPVVTISSGPAEGEHSADPNPSFGFASSEPSANLSCQLDGGGFQPCGSPFAASGLADGSHTFRVRARDAAQNAGLASRTWTVDATVPEVTILSGPADGSTRPNRSPSFTFESDEPDVSFDCQFDGRAFPDCGSPFTRSALADGPYTFQVTATDTAGNTDVASRTWTVDGPAHVAITAGPASGSVSNDPTARFVFSSLDANPNFGCRIDAAPFAPCASPRTTSALADGLHTFRVRETDTALRTAVAWRWFNVDTTAPSIRIKGPETTRTKKRKAAASFLLGASEQVHRRRCRIDSRRFQPCPERYRTPKLVRGIHSLKVKATDRAGNVGAKRKSFRIVKR